MSGRSRHSFSIALAGAILCAVNLLGCSDYQSDRLDEPSNNLPMSRPNPVVSDNPMNSNAPPVVIYPPGIDYPVEK